MKKYIQPNYQLYESEKQKLAKQDLTPREYEEAIKKIAKKCGI